MFENEQEKIGDSYFIIFITVLWVLIIPYSITLFFPVTLALLLWLVFYYKKYIKFLKKSYNFILSIGVVIILFSIYFAIGILSKSTYKIAIAFDNLQYLQNVFFSLTPIILLAIYYLVKNKKIEFYFVVWFCCLLVPTVLYIEGSPTGKIDFSMKTFTLLAVILVPIVAWSLNDAFSNSSKSLKIIIAFFIFAGILNSFCYAFQFVGYRYFGVKKQFFEIDYDYFKTLDYLRVRSNKSSIIFDPQSLQRDDINLTLWLSERRTYLVPKSLHFQGDKRLLDRNNQWEAWRKNGFDKIQECKLSKNIDFLIGKSDWPMSIFFKNEIEFGDFVVMKSIKTLIDCNAIGHE